MTLSAPRGASRATPWPALGDLVAGIAVASILVPQSIAFAQLAGVPPHLGLIAAVLPPLAASFFASSPYLQTGPVAITSVLTFGVLSDFATPGTAEFIGLAALLALLVGIVRLGLGLMRWGFVTYFMSQPVLAGFTTAAAILIVLAQVPVVLGVSGGSAGIVADAAAALAHPGAWTIDIVVVAGLTVLVVLGGRRVHPLTPGVLLAVVGGMLFSQLSGFDGAVVGEIPRGLPAHVGYFPWERLPTLLVPAGVIALMGFAEPSAIARMYAEQDRMAWSPDREFVSQGVANIVAGMSGTFPVGGSFSRSSVARLAGARSRWTGAIAALVVLIFLPVAGVLASLPTAVLGAIVIASVVALIRLKPWVEMFQASLTQAGVAGTTFVLTLALAPRIDLAVLGGVGLAVVVHLWRELLVRVEVRRDGDTLRLEPVGVLFFASAPPLDNAIVQQLAAHPDARRLVIDLKQLGRIDYTGALVLRRIAREAERAGLEVRLTGVPQQARRVLHRVLGGDSPLLDPSGRG
ncbi:MAG TPA: SulP family inorganic anion transporter [Gemmatimonadales bacterium]|jgi:SulP family sulfate permease